MNNIRIEVIKDLETFRSLQNDWIRLSGESTENSFYVQPEFLSIWWEYFGQESKRPFLLKRGINIAGNSCGTESLCVLVAYIGNTVAAILPLMLLTVKPYGETKLLKCLSFLGDYIFNPAPCIVCMEEKREDIFQSFAAFLKESTEWDAIFLNSIRQDFKNLQRFLNILKNTLGGKVIHSPLNEVRFTKCWDRENVLKYLKILAQDKENSGLNNETCKLLNEIKRIDNAEFTVKCLTDITPRLKVLLRGYEDNHKDVITDLYNEISPTFAYIFQILSLPETMEEYEAVFDHRRRHRFKMEEQLRVKEKISFEFLENLSENDFISFVKFHNKRYPNSVHFNDLTAGYYRNLLEELSRKNYLLWLVARESNKKGIFFKLCFHCPYTKTMEWVLHSGERRDVNLNDLSTMMFIKKSIELKCKYFSFRMGAERYKERFHPSPIPLECFIISRNTQSDPVNILPKQFTIAG